VCVCVCVCVWPGEGRGGVLGSWAGRLPDGGWQGGCDVCMYVLFPLPRTNPPQY